MNDQRHDQRHDQQRMGLPVHVANCEIRFGKTPCYVPVDQCETPKQILDWVQQLGPKTWVTTEHINAFIREAADYHGILIQG